MFLSTVVSKLGSPELCSSLAAGVSLPCVDLWQKTCLHLSLNEHCP